MIKFLFFVGFGQKCGSSVVWSILNSHPKIKMALDDELLDDNLSRQQVINRIMKSKAHQGPIIRGIPKRKNIEIIGNKKAYITTDLMKNNPANFQFFVDKMKLEPIFIHPIRDPFDTILSRSKMDYERRKNKKLDIHYFINRNIQIYHDRCRTVNSIQHVLHIKNEELIKNTIELLKIMFSFIGVNTSKKELDIFAKHVKKKLHKYDKKIFTDGETEKIWRTINSFVFLQD